ncbi:MAG: hypothetical protein ACO1NX_08885 [Chitinophagaceae bacterium]
MVFPAVTTAPAVADVERIAAIQQPVIRNLQITQCYSQLSQAFAQRSGPGANWCTFATWASRQAGQTIRKEDLMRTVQAALKLEPEVEAALVLVAKLARQLGAKHSIDVIKQMALVSLISNTAGRASDAVSRGNKKVFEEIAELFAHFMATCFADAAYNQTTIDAFCSRLRPGPPPEGQAYLQQAFGHYYGALFERDEKNRAELLFLANLQVGYHEQTRLQPEIAGSLNAAAIGTASVKSKLMLVLFPGDGYVGRFRLFWQRLFQQTALLDKAIAALAALVQQHLRRLLTAQLMTLTLPPGNRLLLAHDLAAAFPDCLQHLANDNLLTLLAQIDPTPNSQQDSGAVDWAHLPERMHFITDLFRCYHLSPELFQHPFTPEQVAAMQAGVVPPGPL